MAATLTSAQMLAIVQAGGTVVWNGQIIATAAQVPSDDDIAAQTALATPSEPVSLPVNASKEAGGNLAATAAVLGTKTDAVATDTTSPWSVLSFLRGMLAVLGFSGDANVAAGAVGSLSAKLRRVTQGLEDLKTLLVLAAGTNIIGKVGIDQTTPGTTNAVVATGNVASGAADSGNPQKVGGKYNATPPTLADGQRGDVQQDAAANLRVTLGTQIEGENGTYHRMLTGRSYNPIAISTATTTTAKSGAGLVGRIIAQGGTLGTVKIYDNTAASGTVLLDTVTPLQGQILLEDVPFGTGLTIVTGSATVINGGYL